MADQKSGDAAISAAVNTYFVKKVLKDFEPKVKFYESAPIKTIVPKGGGSTVEFTRYRKIDPKTTDNTDEFTATQAYLSTVVITATLRERDEYVQLSRFADLTALGGPLEQAVDKVGNLAAKSLDKLVRNDIGMAVADLATPSAVNMNNLAIDGGTLNSSGVGAKVFSHTSNGEGFPMYHNKTRIAQSAQVVSFASSAMTMKTLNHAVNVLATKDVDPLSNGKFCLIAHPTVVYQLFTSTGFKGWHQHTTSSPAMSGPAGVRELDHTIIKQTTHAYAFPLSGDTLSTSSGTLYCSLLFGSEAYGVAEIGETGFKLYIKKSGPTTVSDPTNMKRQVGYTVRGVAKVLNKSAGLWILTTEL